MKKKLCIALAVLMAFSGVLVLAVGSSAEELISGDYYYEKISNVANTCKITQYVGQGVNGVVDIDDTINGLTVTVIGERAFTGNTITEVNIPDTVEEIEKDAFWRCPNLTSITIPKGVVKIGDHAIGWNFVSSYSKVLGFKIYAWQNTAGAEYAHDYASPWDYAGVDVGVEQITLQYSTYSLTTSVGDVTLVPTFTSVPALQTVQNQVVRWKSSNETVAYVNQNGKVFAVGNGTATITATSANSLKTATCVVTVSGQSQNGTTTPVTGVKFNFSNPYNSAHTSTSVTFARGSTYDIVYDVLPADATNKNVTITSSNSNVTVQSPSSSNGNKWRAVANSIGTAVLTITTTDGAKTATCNATVNASGTEIAVTGVNWTFTVNANNQFGMTVGNLYAIKYEVLPSNATDKRVEITVFDSTGAVTTNAITIDQAPATGATLGTFRPLRTGTYTLRIRTVDGGFEKTVIAVITAVTGVEISLKSDTAKTKITTHSMYKDATEEFVATVAPAAASQTVTWKSDDEKIAKVDATGKVTAVGLGTTKITATSVDTSKKAEVEVTVSRSIIQWLIYIFLFGWVADLMK